MSRVLITGATGFVGNTVLQAVSGQDVVCVGRTRPVDKNVSFFEQYIGSDIDYVEALKGVNTRVC